MPAPQPVQALLLFFEFRERELLLGDLAFDLGVELAAVGDELHPLIRRAAVNTWASIAASVSPCGEAVNTDRCPRLAPPNF